MEPVFRRGDFAYVDPDVAMRPNDYLAVERDGATTVRRLSEENGRLVVLRLSPPEVECVLHAGNETMVRGVVVFWGRAV